MWSCLCLPLDRTATCSSVTNTAKRVELELPAAVPEVWLVLWLCTVVVGRSVIGMTVVGVAVVTLASAPGQPVHSHRPRQVPENRHPISLSPRLNVLRCYTFQVARLGWPARHAPCVYPTNQVGYKIVIAR